MKTQLKIAIASATLAALLAGCATGGGGYYGGQQQPYPGDPNQPQQQQGGMSKTQKGALIGALAGVAAGLLSGNDATERRQRALIGAGVGGLAGGASLAAADSNAIAAAAAP